MSLMKVLAIDLGASSGRVMQAVYNGSSLQLSEVHRFKNEPVNLKRWIVLEFVTLIW